MTPPHIGIYQADVVGHRREQERHSSYIIYIVYGSRTSALKLTSNTKLTRSHNAKKLLQHTELNTSLRKLRLLLATSGIISLRKTVVPSEAISHQKTVVPSKANPLLASANPDLARIKNEK